MDNFDLEILRLLQLNCRTSTEDIGEQIGLSASSCQRRIKKLKQGGFIDNRYGEFTLDPAVNPNSAVNIDGASYQTVNNQQFVQDDFNQNKYQGFRLSGQYYGHYG